MKSGSQQKFPPKGTGGFGGETDARLPSLPVLTGAEGRALQMAHMTFSGLGAVDPAFERLARWHLVTIARGTDPRRWFANTTSLGREALKEMGQNR